jgi:tRNA G18 (ribose-2'-O)-methylase SpoU
VRVRIRQTGSLDSLNVGHAAAIAFHHFRMGSS